jgi:hypothetical protein
MRAGQRTSALVEMVDLMPTLLELTGLTIPDAADLEGDSLVPLMQLPRAPEMAPLVDSSPGSALAAEERRRALLAAASWKNATFTCYPRCCGPHGWNGGCNVTNHFDTSNQCTTTASSDFFAMGYSVRSVDWRYTRWMVWDGASLSPLWDSVIGEELYDHRGDVKPFDIDRFENINLAMDKSVRIQAIHCCKHV